MVGLQRIEEVFSPERLVAICEDEFGPLAEQIAFNLMTKTADSGSAVNSLGLPYETTGGTAGSLQTVFESSGDGLTVSFVGRKGIRNIDEGSSATDVQEEFGSFEAFLRTIERWARAKEARWNLEPGEISAFGVASNVWDHGTVLHQEGGGTEMMKDLLPQTIEKIGKTLAEELDSTIYQLLNTSIEL